MTDIEIAQKNEMIAISEVAKKIGIEESALELYGKHKAKINFSKLRELQE
ncbi:MAG: formate--tetrahydrofolate ligase, partial [Treponemataceae bacterium]|nr:formate--tetrahydrofolate ligase [Treponemataceae bacterium]